MPIVISGTNGISGVDGTASNPSYEGTDANTGVFFPAADTVAIATGGTQRLTVNSSGNTQTVGTISVGNATPSTSGAGITFPATQSASSDANTLDDYEEGTWTPSIGGTATYSEQNGRYTKIGRVVIVEYTLSITTRGTGSTTDISGLPFPINSNIQATGVPSYYANLAVNVLAFAAYGFNASAFRFYGRDTAGVSANGPLGIFGNGAYIQGNLIYYTT